MPALRSGRNPLNNHNIESVSCSVSSTRVAASPTREREEGGENNEKD